MQTTVESTVGPDDVRALAQATDEPQWLATWRHEAWDVYDATPLPDRVAHLWRYSEPDKYLPRRVTPLTPSGAPDPSRALPTGLAEVPAAAAIVEDSDLQTCYLDPELSAAGVIFTDLATAAREHPELVRQHLGSAIGSGAGKFEALNAALFAGGLFVYVPRDVEIQKPIHLIRRGLTDLSALFARLLVVVDQGAKATVIDEYSNTDNPRMIANAVVEGIALPNASLNYFNIQRWGGRTRSHANQRFNLQRDANVTTVNIGLGGQYNKSHLTNAQQGANAQAEMIGVIFGDREQHFDSHTEHLHESGNTYSDMDFKVVLEDRAHSAYTGLIRIEETARHCEAYQENRNLMLDPTCRAESIPELEILNEDVSCTHGATVGPIDEEQVYYLATRGLARRDAQKLIVEGFFGPALDRIDDEALRDRLWAHIDTKIEGRQT